MQNGTQTTPEDGRRLIYFYSNRDEPEKIRQFVPARVNYWKNSNLDGYLGGSCGERTGGLITFEAVDLETANSLVQKDRFVSNNLVGQMWI